MGRREVTDLSALRSHLMSVHGTAQGQARLEDVGLVGDVTDSGKEEGGVCWMVAEALRFL